MKPPERIETTRLCLRKPRLDDAESIFTSYAQDPEVIRFLVWRPHKNIEETRVILTMMLGNWEQGSGFPYAITIKGSDSAIGMVAIHPEDPYRAAIGYVLARPFWGGGYMTEAACAVVQWLLQQPDIYRVYATCDAENPASARVMEKAGMQREGLLRKYIVHPNISDVPRDSYMYAVVK